MCGWYSPFRSGMMGRIWDNRGVAGVSIEGPGVPGSAASSCSAKPLHCIMSTIPIFDPPQDTFALFKGTREAGGKNLFV